ncbi:MAG: hypothetical protein Q7S99_14285 [Parvibaculum sp.]|nr:hypothetical protein [Parvibaculum sp.]
MPKYKDLDGDSGVVGFELGPDWIEVEFESGAAKFYRYTYASAGIEHVNEMKQLAIMGEGLNAYINLRTKKLYASKR